MTVDVILVIGGKHGRHGLRIVVLVLLIVAVVGAMLWIRERRRDEGDAPVLGGPMRVRKNGKVSPGEPGASTAPDDGGRNPGEAEHHRGRELTKRYGETLAVDDLSFEVRTGYVTGFFGPNGAGKSTTMRMIMGLDSPDDGSVAVNGHRYHELGSPFREVGALPRARATTPVAAPMPICGCWPGPIRSRAHGRRSARASRPDPGCSTASGPVLAGHEPTTRYRRRSARRSGRVDVRRAGERAGHRWDPLGSPATPEPCL